MEGGSDEHEYLPLAVALRDEQARLYKNEMVTMAGVYPKISSNQLLYDNFVSIINIISQLIHQDEILPEKYYQSGLLTNLRL